MRAALAVAVLLGACTPPPEAPPELPDFALFDVVDAEVARLEEELRLEPASLPDGRTREDVEEQVHGLVTFLSSASGSLRQSALLDVETLGDCAVDALATYVHSDTGSDAERAAAIELLGHLDSVRSSAQLLAGTETAQPGWVRAHCAWRLGQGTADWTVPRLVKRLKYETHGESVVWMAVALARFGNLSGLVGLRELARSGSDGRDGGPDVRTAAARELARLAEEHDAERLDELGGAADGTGLSRVWSRWDPAELRPEPPSSDRYRLEVWRWIAALDEFQLRGVDDARFVLSRLGPTAALCLARALHDESPYVRVHSAQALERMGPRGVVAGPELVKALGDPELAPSAAVALGSVAHPDAAPALEGCLPAGRPLGLRVAAARALGYLGLARSVDALLPLLDAQEPVDLRQAAAESLVYCGRAEPALPVLAELIDSGRVDSASSFRAVGWLLASRARREEPGAAELLERWSELEPPAGVVETVEALAARTRDRLALLREWIAPAGS